MPGLSLITMSVQLSLSKKSNVQLVEQSKGALTHEPHSRQEPVPDATEECCIPHPQVPYRQYSAGAAGCNRPAHMRTDWPSKISIHYAPKLN
jgi:hypothetical protein